MSTFLNNEETLRQITPRQIRTLLRMKRWVGTTSDPVWIKTLGDETYSVTVPLRSDVRDYALVVSELLRTVAISESSSSVDIWRELKETSFDVQEFRLLPETASGTIPIEEASTAFSAVEDLVAASATSLRSPGPVMPRRPTEINQFMKHVLAGPTREGSYILTLLTPIPPRLNSEEDQVLFEVDDAPFERAVTLRMLEALSAVKTAATVRSDLDDESDPFASTVDSGVSANFCEALVRLSSNGAVDFEVDFKWALDRPIQSDISSVSIGRELIPAIQSAASMFRLLVDRPRIDLTGSVTRLHRETQSGNGDVTISGTFLLREIQMSVKATVNLAQSDYEDAITAHQEKKIVTIQGNIVRKGTRSYLEQPALFQILD